MQMRGKSVVDTDQSPGGDLTIVVILEKNIPAASRHNPL